MNKKTELMELVEAMQHDDSHIGDLCNDIIRDLKFPTLGTEKEQIQYLMLVCREYNVKVALIDFFEILLGKLEAEQFQEELLHSDSNEDEDGE
jgi:hypothetical protein